jgi:hypothetical protein
MSVLNCLSRADGCRRLPSHVLKMTCNPIFSLPIDKNAERFQFWPRHAGVLVGWVSAEHSKKM